MFRAGGRKKPPGMTPGAATTKTFPLKEPSVVETTVSYTRAQRAIEPVPVALINVRPAQFSRYSGLDQELFVLAESQEDAQNAIAALAPNWRVTEVRWLNRSERREAAAPSRRLSGGGA